MADQRAERTVAGSCRHRRIEDRRLQHGRGDDQPVVRQLVRQRGLLRQYLPATTGIVAADPAHFLAMPPGRGDQHVAAEAAAAHRLHAVVEVAPRGADFDAQVLQLRQRLRLGGIAHPGAAFDRARQRVADLAGDGLRLLPILRREVSRRILAAQHGPGGEVDRVQRLLPARCGHRLPAQHLAAEVEGGIAPRLGQVRRHCVADAPAQVALPLLRLQPRDQLVELREKRGVGDGHGVVADALGLEERVELQVAVLLAEAGSGDWREVCAWIAQVDQRTRGAGDPGLEFDHRAGLGGGGFRGHAGQDQDLLDVLGVPPQQGAGVGVAAGVVGRIRQAQAALAEIAQVPPQVAQVEFGAEVEGHGDADLVQGGDRRGDVLGLADRVDPLEQGGHRVRAVAVDRGLIKSARPEVAQQFLHIALRGVHRRVQQVALLLEGECAQLA